MDLSKKVGLEGGHETPIRLINLSLKGYLTSPRLFEMGIYSCFSCGAHGSLDVSSCGTCGEGRFVVVDNKEKTCNGVHISESRVSKQPHGL